jgi:DNA-directed RNA polymerase specialized sigma24 family protein
VRCRREHRAPLLILAHAGDHGMSAGATHRTVEQAVRASYGRLLAFLAARTRDVAAAEDALAAAFHAALEHWPRICSCACGSLRRNRAERA